MKLTRRLGLLVVMAALAFAMSLASVGAASATVVPHSHGGSGGGGTSGGGGGDDGGGGSGGGGTSGGGGGGSGGGGSGGGGGGGGPNGRLRINGTCGDQLTLRIKTAGSLDVDIAIPSADPTEQWTLTATEQDYDAVTGGRIGNPVDLVPNEIPVPVFSTSEGGFDSDGDITDTSGVTHGISYTATRTTPTPLTCTNTGYWTSPAGSAGPTAENPSSRPDTAPALTGATEADSGANDVAVQFDQEMLSTAQGMPATSRFAVTVDGTSRNVTAVSVVDDSPPLHALVDVTFDGAPLVAGQTVTLQYRQPLTASDPALQDLEGLETASFGPLSVPTF